MATKAPNAVIANVTVKTFRYHVLEVSAGTDTAQTVIASFPNDGHILAVRIVNGRETAPAITSSNTATITLERGASGSESTFATVVYDDTNAFPAINTVDTGLTLTPAQFKIAAGDVLAYTVVQAASGDLPNSWFIEVDYV